MKNLKQQIIYLVSTSQITIQEVADYLCFVGQCEHELAVKLCHQLIDDGELDLYSNNILNVVKPSASESIAFPKTKDFKG